MSNQFNKKSIKDISVKGKRVLVRVDYNVPVKNGVIQDDTRIKATIPTLKALLEQEPKVLILMSHFGRPKGKVLENLSLKIIPNRLEALLGEKVGFVDDCMKGAEQIVESEARVWMLENLRFYAEETKGGDQFKKTLSSYCDVYVNDAFGTCHRAHSSMVGVEAEHRVAGLLIEKELKAFGVALIDPPRPFLAILGGAKVRDKIQLIGNLLDKVNEMIIVGGMAYTFKKVLEGMKIGQSLYDEQGAEIVEDLMKKAEKNGVKIHFPVDFRCNNEFKGINDPPVFKGDIPDDMMGLDIGPETEKMLIPVIKRAKIILWNGPAGVFEIDCFAHGSETLLHEIVKATKDGTISIIGGGDTANLCVSRGKQSEVTHVSTGGGASLEMLEGKVLPGIEALDNK